MGPRVTRAPLALGLDVGNAKLKLCAARPGEAPRWTSVTLPYDARRPYARQADFALGVPRALRELVGDEAVGAAVAVTSAGYAYPSFDASVVHLAELLQACLPGADTRLLSFEGEALTTRAVLDGDPALRGPIAFTNPVGAVMLAQRGGLLGAPARGLVLDTGGSTTGTVALTGEGAEAGACPPEERALYTRFRARTGRLAWFGVQTTPLEALVHEVMVDESPLPVVPRGVPFENVAVWLELLPQERAKKLAFFGLAPTRAEARRALADAVGLDALSDAATTRLCEELYERAVLGLSRALTRVIASAPVAACGRALCFGLGARALAAPALRRAGVPEVILAEDHMPPELAEIASCYGAFVVASELVVRA